MRNVDLDHYPSGSVTSALPRCPLLSVDWGYKDQI